MAILFYVLFLRLSSLGFFYELSSSSLDSGLNADVERFWYFSSGLSDFPSSDSLTLVLVWRQRLHSFYNMVPVLVELMTVKISEFSYDHFLSWLIDTSLG